MFQRLQSLRHISVILALVWFTGMGLIAYFSYQSYLYFQRRELESGQVAFDKAYFIAKEKLNSYVYGLQGMGGVYLVQDYAISPENTRDYAQFRNYFSNFPGALGFGFIRYIPEEKLESYKKEVVRRMPDFVIKRLSDKNFGDYMIIESIEPMQRNFYARGLDVGSELTRRAAALRAMETGEATLTSQIQLVQVDTPQPGFLFYLPLYKRNQVPATVEERRKEIVGWAYAPILSSDVGNHLKKSFDEGLNFAIYEVGPKGLLQIFGNSLGPGVLFSRVIDIGGVKWLLKASYQEKTIPGYRWAIPLIIFVFFSGVFSALCLYLHKLIVSRQESVQRAQKVEHQLEALINGASFAIIATDSAGVIKTVNKATLDMLGYSEEELLSGKTPEVFHDPGEIQQRSEEMSAELGYKVDPGMDVFMLKARTHGIDISEWSYVRKDGSRFPVRLVVTRILSSEGEIEGFLGIAEDITEVVSMRKTIEAQQQQMISSAKLSSLGEMAGGIAHEINNPLTIIMSKIKLLDQKISQGDIPWDSLKLELSKIDQTTLRIAKIVRGLKTFSRESDKDPKEVVRISQIINDSVDLCGEKFRHYEIDLRVNKYEDIEISCRATQISQVLVNLMGNAFDAISHLPDKWINLTVEKKGPLVEISVTDSGGGIPDSVAEKIMHPFFTTKEVGKGTGLGLSISKGLIEDHGGRLYLDKSSANTRFVIELPIL